MPGPDPDRPKDETKWMPSEQIQEEALQKSTNWVQAGSGDLGTVYFEVIGCDNLPNMDTFAPGKTDCFACVVYEDSVVTTDVIPNCLSPRWFPWTYRAFKFQMAHPATDVLLGIFDHDNAYNPAQLVGRAANVKKLHDAVGRVVIELSKLQPNTTYLLKVSRAGSVKHQVAQTLTYGFPLCSKYPLYYGETQKDRESALGTVTVRVRMEIESVRKTLFTALMPPQKNVISLRNKSEWAVAYCTAHGSIDDEKFSIGTMTKYIEELQGYLDLLEVVKRALLFVSTGLLRG